MDIYSRSVRAVTKVADLRRIVRRELKRNGFVGKNSLWEYPGDEVRWEVRLDTGEWGKQLSVDHEAYLPNGASVLRPGADIFLGFGPGSPYFKDYEFADALNTVRGAELENREEIICRGIEAIADYSKKHATLEAVREAYRRGDFDRGLIHWRGKDILEGREPRDEPPPSKGGGKIIIPD